MISFCSIPEAIDELKKGHMLIVLDDPKRENQADLIFPAEIATAKKIAFLINNCRGLICVAIDRAKADQLTIPLMVPSIDNTESTGVQFTVSVDATRVKSFGISATDRAKTIQTIADFDSKPDDLVRPGHVFPLLARDGGVLQRQGHTEATVDLMKLANFSAAGVLCEILNEQGNVVNKSELAKFSQKHQIKIVTIGDLVSFEKSTLSL